MEVIDNKNLVNTTNNNFFYLKTLIIQNLIFTNFLNENIKNFLNFYVQNYEIIKTHIKYQVINAINTAYASIKLNENIINNVNNPILIKNNKTDIIEIKKKQKI